MQLPPVLRAAVDAALEGVERAEIIRAAAQLSLRYRGEVADGRLHLDDKMSALAYLAVRLPATYAAIRASLAAAAQMRGDFVPATMLDIGAGPGTALWAARDMWPTVERAVLVEKSRAIRKLGEILGADLQLVSVQWRHDDLSTGLGEVDPSDLVIAGYVLNEIEEPHRNALIDRLWALTRDMVVIVEPGTTAGWARMLSARDRLLAGGAHILAPCPHGVGCPLVWPDWCHFSQRVARSKIHRKTKAADVPWEDEKFIYLAVSRKPGLTARARVIAPARAASGRMRVKLCRSDGAAEWRLVTRREGDVYRKTKRLEWGDAVEL
jgi:ribosomal protein RSM22 (predicted rRNA methylase)